MFVDDYWGTIEVNMTIIIYVNLAIESWTKFQPYEKGKNNFLLVPQ